MNRLDQVRFPCVLQPCSGLVRTQGLKANAVLHIPAHKQTNPHRMPAQIIVPLTESEYSVLQRGIDIAIRGAL